MIRDEGKVGEECAEVVRASYYLHLLGAVGVGSYGM